MNIGKTLHTALLFTLLTHAIVASAESDGWQHIEGLPCEEVSSVVQGHDGYMWFGTRLGLIRYDGYNMHNYRNDTDHPYVFSSCNIRCLMTDAEGLLYAGSFFGLNIMDLRSRKVSITHFENSDLLNDVLLDDSGRLWVGTDRGLYCRTKNAPPRSIKQLDRDVIYHLGKTATGQVVVTTGKKGVFLIDKSGRCRPVEGTESIAPCATCVDTQGTLWIGTRQHGLYSLHDGQLCREGGYEDYTVNDMTANPDGTGLILATDCGLFFSEDGSVALRGKNIQSLCVDRGGNIWAATETEGVYRKQNFRTRFITGSPAFIGRTVPIVSQFETKSLNDTALWSRIPNINAIYINRQGTGYIGTQGSGLYITKKGRVTHHLTESNTSWLRTNDIYAFSTLGPDSTLIASWDGLYLMRDDHSGRYVAQIGTSSIEHMHTLSVFHPCEGELWLGLVGGIAHIRGTSPENAEITVYTHVNKKGVAHPDDVGLLTDLHDEIGDYQLGGVYRIVKDRQGRVWACTSEPGLLLYDADADAFRSVSQQMGIRGDNVHSMDIDRFGNFWMTTNYGILQITVNDAGIPTKQHLYTQKEGLPANYFGSTMSNRLADGSICFLNRQHLIRVVPHRDFGVSEQVSTYISDILVNGVPVDESRADIDAAPPFTRRLILTHEQNHLTFRFTAQQYGQESSLRYVYMLEGADRDYRQTEMGGNSVQYSLLSPGHYTLRYFSSPGSDGEHGEEHLLEIEIRHPLWWTWWARTLYTALLLCACIIFAHTFKERRRRQRQLEVLEMEKRQQEQLYREKMQFYTRIFHEFMTPLTLLSDLSHNLHERVRPSLQATLFMLTCQVDRLKEAMSNVAEMKEDASGREALRKAKEMTQVDREFLNKCTESVNRHIDDVSYSHQVMMDEVGASHATLYRKLKALTGMDATSFIRSIRMRAACQIMSSNPDIRISELAERVGYSNPRYFSACFKSEFGMTPREYLEQGGGTA